MKTTALTTAILMLVALLMAGCVQAATTSGTIFDTETEPEAGEAVSVFAIAVTPLPMPAVTAAALQEPPSGECAVREEVPSPTPANTPEPFPEQTQKPAYTVKDIDDEKGYVYAKTVNLRCGPGTDYEVVGEFRQNDRVTVTGKTGDWYRVKIDGSTGFMLREYVKLGDIPKNTPKPTAKATPKPTPKPTSTPKPPEESAPDVIPKLTPRHNTEMNAGSSSYTADELYLLAQLVYKEGDGESYAAVAGVIQNRIRSSKFPNSVNGVVYQSGQFSTSSLKQPSSSAENAVTEVFINGNNPLPPDVLFFRASSGWSGHELYGRIGGNYFYY